MDNGLTKAEIQLNNADRKAELMKKFGDKLPELHEQKRVKVELGKLDELLGKTE